MHVFIWRADDNGNKYGHAAMQTDKYYISFWPEGNKKAVDAIPWFTSTLKGALIFHRNFDKYLEGNRDPVTYKIPEIPDAIINEIYEKFLR